MSLLYIVAGIFIYGVTVVDLVKTTLSSKGGGVITNLLSKLIWNIFFIAARKNGKSKVLDYAGVFVLLFILLTWVMGMWTGLLLVFLSDSGSIQNSSTLLEASAMEKFYFVGYSLFTLGNGDFKPASDAWRLITNFATFSGLAFITTSITYFIPVLSAVNLQSKLSLYINGMGKTPEQIVYNSWNGNNFSSFFDIISDLGQMLMQHTLNHHSYPVVHYFHDSNQQLAVILNIVKLDEAYRMFAYDVEQDRGVDKLKLSLLGTTLDYYMSVVISTATNDDSTKRRAPDPDLKKLIQKGVPIRHESEKIYLHSDLQQRREQLTYLLENNGWSWKEVYHP